MTKDIEIELTDGRILKTTVDVEFVWEKNPGGREVAHYSGSEDGWTIEDWTLGEVEIDGVFYPQCPPDLYDLIEKEVERLSPDDA